MKRALIFDCDGVLGDTERDGHRVAFNRMWSEAGVAWEWTATDYAPWLAIGGGKERMLALLDDPMFRARFEPPADTSARQRLVQTWHAAKTRHFQEMVVSGVVPARSGVRRLAAEALTAGWVLAVASTSAPASVHAMLDLSMGAELAARFELVLAGDCVPCKKPAPDIYLLALTSLGVRPADGVVIEDSHQGLQAAQGAGLACVITPSAYTGSEDFTEAQLVVSCLGDPGGETCRVLANRSSATPGPWLGLSDLARLLDDSRRRAFPAG